MGASYAAPVGLGLQQAGGRIISVLLLRVTEPPPPTSQSYCFWRAELKAARQTSPPASPCWFGRLPGHTRKLSRRRPGLSWK